MIEIYKCKFCGKRIEIKVDSSKESYGSMDMYVEKYSNKFMAHKCNELFTGVMELVAVRE